jgi:hypothetical protein
LQSLNGNPGRKYMRGLVSPDFDYAVELHRLVDRIEKASIVKE